MNNYDSEEIVNVGSGDEISIKDLATTIKNVVGFKGMVSFNTDYPDGTPRKFLDTSRLRKLGWKPKISLKEGLESTYRDLLRTNKFNM